ncbi:MAG: hypothetical protein F9K23_15755 [Bacteroidetes bacterium]|nr:MAG: hypothetical protein F9K23_15755 [Bacteroidota bacterium]
MEISNEKINQIAEAIANKNHQVFSNREYDKFTDGLFWAWENWANDVIESYHKGFEKPEEPTHEFRLQYTQDVLSNVPEEWQELIESFNQ